MMNSVVSVIVPVFNAEPFLSDCLDSVINQSYVHWELILVDDGSQDASSVICDRYALGDSRIHVIHKENTGVSDTRNKALDVAIGKYVIFLDADDYWCDDNILARMVNVADVNNLDIVRGEYKAVDEGGRDLFCRPISPERLVMSGKIMSSSEFLRKGINGEFFLVLSLFRRSILQHIRFEKGRIFLEDMRFYAQVLLQDLRCMYLPDLRFYMYRKNGDSASARINPLKIKDSFEMCDFFHSLISKVKENKMKEYYQHISIGMYYATLETLSHDEYYKECRRYIVDFKIKEKRKNVSEWISDYGLRKKFLSIVYYVSPMNGVYLFRLKHKLGAIKRKLFH